MGPSPPRPGAQRRGGEDALGKVDGWGESIDLLVTDVVMPRVSGPELVRRLSTRLPRLDVLYMSGYSKGDDLCVMSEVGRAVVLEKPFSTKKLEAEVRKILDRRPGRPADPR